MKRIVLGVMAVVLSVPFSAPHQTQLCQPEIDTVEDIGAIGHPASVTARDGGASAIIGDRVLWTFGDTLFNPASVDGTHLRSSTAALADPATPLRVQEPLDVNGAPAAFLPLTKEEQDFNDSHPGERIALWPVSVILDSDQSGVIFYLKLNVRPGFLNYQFVGTGIAHVTVDVTTAVRDKDLLFNAPDPLFASAALIGSEVYVYGALTGSQNMGLARVPLQQVGEPNAYRFWNGTDWGTDVRTTAVVLRDIPGDVSVSHNAFLKRYLAVHSQILSNKVVFQSAEQPEGPWSDPVEVFTGLPAGNAFDYAAREHPELSSENGQTIMISYYHPLGGFKGELRLVRLRFKAGC